MKNVYLSQGNIQKLLNSINNDEDKSTVQSYLKELMDSNPNKSRSRAIFRGLLKIGETLLIKELVSHLFD